MAEDAKFGPHLPKDVLARNKLNEFTQNSVAFKRTIQADALIRKKQHQYIWISRDTGVPERQSKRTIRLTMDSLIRTSMKHVKYALHGVPAGHLLEMYYIGMALGQTNDNVMKLKIAVDFQIFRKARNVALEPWLIG